MFGAQSSSLVMNPNRPRGGSRPRETIPTNDLITSNISGMSGFSGLRPHQNLISATQNSRHGQSIYNSGVFGKSIENQNPNVATSLVNQKYNEQLIHQLKKKEKHTRDLLEQMTKKFKNLEKKSQEDSKISLELKKRHDVMQKKA